jgi:hypothetical protein
LSSIVEDARALRSGMARAGTKAAGMAGTLQAYFIKGHSLSAAGRNASAPGIVRKTL